jgi:hypothetical protein
MFKLRLNSKLCNLEIFRIIKHNTYASSISFNPLKTFAYMATINATLLVVPPSGTEGAGVQEAFEKPQIGVHQLAGAVFLKN